MPVVLLVPRLCAHAPSPPVTLLAPLLRLGLMIPGHEQLFAVASPFPIYTVPRPTGLVPQSAASALLLLPETDSLSGRCR